MYYTEALQQIMEQLQTAHESEFGYFDILFLNSKLIGLLVIPILFVAVVFVTLYFVPKYLSQILVPMDKDAKPYYIVYLWRTQGLDDLTSESLKYTEKYKQILVKRGHLRLCITIGLSLFICFLLSPFFVMDRIIGIIYVGSLIIFWILTVLILRFRYKKQSKCGKNYWMIYGDRFTQKQIKEIEYNIKKQVYEEVQNLNKSHIEMTEKEFEKYVNEQIDSDYCCISIYKLYQERIFRERK